jgi:hypothetical protein
MSHSIIYLFCSNRGETEEDLDEYVTTDALNANSGEFLLLYKDGKGKAYN